MPNTVYPQSDTVTVYCQRSHLNYKLNSKRVADVGRSDKVFMATNQ